MAPSGAILAIMRVMRRFLFPLLQILVLLIIVESLYLLTKQPLGDRTWLPEQARTATAEVQDSITLTNVRDWTYNAQGPVTADWTTAIINPKDITRAWFLIEPFSTLEAVGHTFLSFELSDGRVYSFSVEARREENETYSAIQGLFREYELSYQWGTERDFVTRRLIYLDHPLRLYPLTLSPEASQALFLSLIEETNNLAERPRFYHTLSANCTNVLAKIVNKHYPGTLPWDTSWYLTGYADRYLMREELIGAPNGVEAAIAANDLTPFKANVAALASSTPEVFSAGIRELQK